MNANKLRELFINYKDANKEALLNRFTKVMTCRSESHSKLMMDLGKLFSTSGENISIMIAIENLAGDSSHVIDGAAWEMATNNIKDELNIDLKTGKSMDFYGNEHIVNFVATNLYKNKDMEWVNNALEDVV